MYIAIESVSKLNWHWALLASWSYIDLQALALIIYATVTLKDSR